jgi:GGDEF domain-containing protein
MEKDEITFHPFGSYQQLVDSPYKYDLDLIVFSTDRDPSPELRILKKLKQDIILSLPPAIFFLNTGSKRTLLSCYRAEVDEAFEIPLAPGLVYSKLKNLLSHSRKRLGVNPSTKLPGVSLIDEEIGRRVSRNERFALCYADLDQFKAYNDYYGYHFGNRLIVVTSKIIRDVVMDLTGNGFVGHVGGDDFIFIIPIEKIKQICSGIIKVFDQTIPSCYHERDLRKGYIETVNRDGLTEKFSIISLSIAVFKNTGSTFSHIAEISHMLADLKKYVKGLAGSNYVVERRRKY